MTKAGIAARIEDLRWLDDNGCSLADAVRATGLSEHAIEKWCERHGLRELFKSLMHRSHACGHHCLPDTGLRAYPRRKRPVKQDVLDFSEAGA